MTHVPHLKTTTTVQSDIEKKIISRHIDIESWFREQWLGKTPLITCSVDIRNAGFKIAQVDTNVFPAGFNNLNPQFFPLCVQAMSATLSHAYAGCKNIGIIPESHTRNPFYLESLKIIQETLLQAGFKAEIGTLRDIDKPEQLTVNGNTITQHPITRQGKKLFIGDSAPCLLILNNDLSDGVPEILSGIQQPIIPSTKMGWGTRSKVEHFKQYQSVCEEFSTMLGIDSWHFSPLFTDCNEVDFTQKDSNACLVDQTQMLFDKIKSKYKQHGITQKPFVVIKSDSGTYGMAVMMISSPEEIKDLNRKQRNNMSKNKGGKQVSRVLIQEGVHTIETHGPMHATAEPVLYMIGEFVVGGFYRVHTEKSMHDNLNAPGMHFEPLAFDTCCHTPDDRINPHQHKNLFYVYSVIARLAQLAAIQEDYS